MDLKQLRGFLYVARLASISRAASELRIAQPALSRQVRSLEEDLGVPLLSRHSKGVELTEQGRTVFTHVEGLLDAVEALRVSVNEKDGPVTGTVRLALPPAAGAILLGPLLARFGETHPGIAFHIMEGVGRTLHDWLQTGRADAAIMHNPPPLSTCQVDPLIHEVLYLVGSTKETAPARFDVGDIGRFRLIVPSYPHFARIMLEQISTELGVTLDIAAEVDGPGLTGDLVAAGLGHAVATYASVARRIEAGEVWAVPFTGRKLFSTVGVGYRKESMSEALSLVIDGLKLIVADVVARGLWPGEVHPAMRDMSNPA